MQIHHLFDFTEQKQIFFWQDKVTHDRSVLPVETYYCSMEKTIDTDLNKSYTFCHATVT